MYTESSNYECALGFFQKRLGKKLKANYHFLNRQKTLNSLFRGLLGQTSKIQKLILNVLKKFKLQMCPPFYPKVLREKVKRHFVVLKTIINLFLTGSRLSYQTCISNQDKLYSCEYV